MEQLEEDRPSTEMTFLYFGNDWFAENRTSSHHIARWLANNHRVYYVECPGLRAPKASGRDLKKIWSKVARFARGPRPVGENVKILTLLQVPLHRFRLVRWLNRNLILATLRWHMWWERIHRPVSWFMVPHLSSVAGRLGEQLSVYYCIDDYASLPDVDAQAVRAMDEELTRRADLVFIASETLRVPKTLLNTKTHVSPHGVDVDHFARACDDRTEIPHEMASIPRPIIGFFGLIEQWIDLDLIDQIAARRPSWSIVLIGRMAVPDHPVCRRPNVHLLGKRRYEDLPAYGKAFDAAIIPYHLTQQVLHANPIKLREYLAMGKPVVSVSTPEIDKYADVVEIAHTREEFLARLDVVLSRPATPGEIERRVGCVAIESWDARLAAVLEIVRQDLEGKGALGRPEPALGLQSHSIHPQEFAR
jgi:glycosyltransferase involved in cell wall biosynthesis